MVGTSPCRGFFSFPGGFRISSRAEYESGRNLSQVLLPGARLNNPAEGEKKKEVAKALGALQACQTGMKCPFV